MSDAATNGNPDRRINEKIAIWTKNAALVGGMAILVTLLGFALNTYAEKIQVIDRVNMIEKDVEHHTADIDTLKSGVADMKSDLRDIKHDLRDIGRAVGSREERKP